MKRCKKVVARDASTNWTDCRDVALLRLCSRRHEPGPNRMLNSRFDGSMTYLECTKCGAHLKADHPQTICPSDGGVLFVRYDLATIKQNFKRDSLSARPGNLWRYAEVLPDAIPVSLGEGFTPLLPSREFPGVYIKDEGLNPTASFKARGMSVAVTMAKAYGLKKLAAPSAGNAASALAAYAAAAGLEAHIFMPRDVPMANRVGVHDLRCSRDPGRRPDQRLCPHGGRAQRERRMVRRFDPQRAFPG